MTIIAIPHQSDYTNGENTRRIITGKVFSPSGPCTVCRRMPDSQPQKMLALFLQYALL